ncbi:hypothetical protein SSX86_004502 [Deinandra increscens subsp. villosa]|uniref:Uncharacterized protein n=1 Tax=Deinandra increscens subsp. villosa TaxID=3103831 RepID=A0AAP0H7N6_9ASTR
MEIRNGGLVNASSREKLRNTNSGRPKHNDAVVAQHQNDDSKEIALMKVKIEKLCEIFAENNATKENVEMKQGQLHEEMDVEREDAERQVQVDLLLISMFFSPILVRVENYF